MDGFLSVLKPPGMTSSDVVLYARKRLPRGTRVGHGGTLDPEAAGVLPLCVGRGARLFDYIVDKRKEYIAELRLGVITDTQDATGQVVERHQVSVTPAQLEAAFRQLTGEIEQVPPGYSAIKRDGKRMYQLAREGQAVELPARRVRVEAMELLRSLGPERYLIRIACGKGTYVRTLCHDAGLLLGCGGHMAFLLRSQAGAFTLEDSVTLEEMDAAFREERMDGLLLPLDAPIAHLPRVRVEERYRRSCLNGNPLPAGWLDAPPPVDTPLRVYCGEDFAGIGLAGADGCVRFKAMLLEGKP